MKWFLSNVTGNRNLQVKRNDAEAATEILDRSTLAENEYEVAEI